MLSDKAAEILKAEWEKICSLAESGKLRDWLDESNLLKAVHASVNSSTKTYRYVLPTQILSKLADNDVTRRVFRQVLTEIYRRLSRVCVVYPTPRRVSLNKTMEVIGEFLAEHSGGDRLLALSCALFKVIGWRFGLYAEVKRGKITAADQPSGTLADLECVTKDERLVFAVEVKDRHITISQLRAKLRTMRERQVSEIFFVATQGAVESERSAVEFLIEREFASGQNGYVTDLERLSRTTLALIGEEGRRDFLRETSAQLDKYHSDITHRRAWASI